MAVCYFNNDYSTKYNCEYNKKENGIEVIVDYEIDDEIRAISGVRTFSVDTKFDKRDILIIDYKNHSNYLLKEAGYSGHTNVFGTPDGSSKTKFYSNVYFSCSDYEKLCELPKTPKVKKIKIYSNAINSFIGCPSLRKISNDDEYIISLKNDSQTNSFEVNKNYIKSITIGDCWNSMHSAKDYNIEIKLNGYIEIELTKRVNYDDVYEYVWELIIFMQLLYPNKFNINKTLVMVGDKYYELVLPFKKIDFNDKYVEPSVKDNIIDYLKKCYDLIPYRNSKTEIRNIPYIILNTSRGVEDNFLMFYRFIECYYKKQQIENIRKTFISYSIKNNYKKSNEMSESEIENLSQEIICLRNHYVHSGYYIKNSSLKISFKRVNKKRNPKDYTANNVDFHWIYERTIILYKIVIDIIFSSMLNYDNYKFNKHF